MLLQLLIGVVDAELLKAAHGELVNTSSVWMNLAGFNRDAFVHRNAHLLDLKLSNP